MDKNIGETYRNSHDITLMFMTLHSKSIGPPLAGIKLLPLIREGFGAGNNIKSFRTI